MIFNVFIACIVGIFTLSLHWQPEGLSKVVKVKIPSDYRKLVKHAEGKTPPPGTHITLSSLYLIKLTLSLLDSHHSVGGESGQ